MAEADPQIRPETAAPVLATEDTAVSAEPKRKWGRLALMLSVPLALLVAGGLYWMSLQGKVSTDNAYVQQDKVAVSALVGGEIVEAFVKDGDVVQKGQLLFRIDAEPYRLQIAQAVDCVHWLPNDLLTKLDRCLMAHGVEGRTPFLDPEVAGFAFAHYEFAGKQWLFFFVLLQMMIPTTALA